MIIQSCRPLVLYHGGGCADGFTAAWVAHRFLGDDADYVPVNYGQEPPDVTGRVVYVLDFSYKRPVLLGMASKAERIYVLDHHKTAKAELWGEGIFWPANTYIKFDLEKSGGRLAWEHFFPGQPSPWLVDYTEDRDLWRWKLPQSRAISAWLASLEWSFEDWDILGDEPGRKEFEECADQGNAILRYQQQVVDSQCKNAREIDLDGHKVLAVNATVLISEIAGQLAQDRPFGASFFIRDDGKKVWSLRSREGGIDVSEIAKRHGGGGHPRSAGFEEAV